MNKIKCVHIITKLEFGGAQDNTLYTLENLDDNIYEKYLICGMGALLDETAKKSGKFKLFFNRFLIRELNFFYDLAALAGIYILLLRIRPDIVHTHSSKAGIIGRWAAFFAGTPLIIHTYHGFGFNKFQKNIYRSILMFAEQITSKITGGLIAVSKDNKEYALANKIGGGIDFEVIHSGIRRPKLKNGFNIGDVVAVEKGDVIITNISCLKPQKNLLDYIELADLTLNKYSNKNALFLLIGGGDMRSTIENAINERGISSRVFLLGWRDDAHEILASSDIFVLTSLWEGLPRAMVEAMYYSKPSLAYDVDGIKDLLVSGKNGYIIPAGDVTMMAQKLDTLIKNPDLAKSLGLNAKKSLDDSFFIDNMVVSIAKYYDKLRALTK